MRTVNKVDVVIGGEIITLVSDEHEAYMQKLARYIDKKITEIKSATSNATINERTRTILIAVNVADDYFKILEQFQQLQKSHKKFISEMGRMQEENMLLNERIHELQEQLNQSRAELEEYIENFDNPNNLEAQEEVEEEVDDAPQYGVEAESQNIVSLSPIMTKIL